MSAVDGNDGLSRTIRYVEEGVPFEPSYYNRAYLGKRIAARTQRRSAADHAEYLGTLRRDAFEPVAKRSRIYRHTG